jgi:hypothetical protein
VLVKMERDYKRDLLNVNFSVLDEPNFDLTNETSILNDVIFLIQKSNMRRNPNLVCAWGSLFFLKQFVCSLLCIFFLPFNFCERMDFDKKTNTILMSSIKDTLLS